MPKRSFSNSEAVILWEDLDIDISGGLSAKTLTVSSQKVLTANFRIIKSEFWITGIDGVSGDLVPLLIGYADGDLAASEIEEVMEANLLDPGDTTGREKATRYVKPLGFIVPQLTGSNYSLENTLSGACVTRWTFNEATGWRWFAYNRSATTIASGTTAVRILAKHYGVWLD